MKPILFNAEMVRAILDGRKTVTRRPVKYKGHDGDLRPVPITARYTGEHCGRCVWEDSNNIYSIRSPYHLGDILYVRETWCEEFGKYYFRADFDSDYLESCETLSGGYPSECRYYPGCAGCTRTNSKIRWNPSIHMPKEAARIFLRVTDVRVERLKDIMEDPPGPQNQVVREGCKYGFDFIAKWDRNIKKKDRHIYGWYANPWVWRIEFEHISREEVMSEE